MAGSPLLPWSPLLPGPPLLPGSPSGPEGGPKILKRKSSWHRRRRSKILAASLKHWKGRGGGGALPAAHGRSNTSLAGPRPPPCRGPNDPPSGTLRHGSARARPQQRIPQTLVRGLSAPERAAEGRRGPGRRWGRAIPRRYAHGPAPPRCPRTGMHEDNGKAPPPPLCDIPSGCCFFTGPWTVTRSPLRMLRRVAAFCRPLRPVLQKCVYLQWPGKIFPTGNFVLSHDGPFGLW